MTRSTSHATPRLAPPSPESLPVRDRILEGAVRCLERFGVPKTTMEDVAGAAGCSRQTVYKHFASKDDLVTAICLAEWERMTHVIHPRLGRHRTVAARIAESVLAAVQLGRDNVYVRRLLEPPDIQARLTTSDDPMHALQRERWAPLLDQGRRNGELADDMPQDDVVAWLTLGQMALFVKFRSANDDATLEKWIHRFVVAPLLRPRDGA